MGPEGQQIEHPLTRVDEVVIRTKRRSEYETDMPRQSKRFKPTLDGGDNTTAEPADIEEGGECAASEDWEDIDEPELDDYAVAQRYYEAEMEWEDDEGELVMSLKQTQGLL